MSALTRRIAFFSVSATIALLASAIFAFTASGAVSPTNDVKLKILSTTIPGDLKPVVTFTLTNSAGQPVALADLDQNGLKFTIAAIQNDPATGNTKYVNYVVNNATGTTYNWYGETRKAALATATQAAVDSGGTFSDLGGGKFTYTFAKAAPKDYNPQDTHAVGGYATRGNRASVSNDVFYFVPAGGAVQTQRQVVTIEACNGCHDALAPHGGTRRDTKLCVLCHTSQSTDVNSGSTVDFKVLVHKIHQGANLPSVEGGQPYFIGNSSHDFSTVRWPQDTRNCKTCHTGPQGDNYKTKPSAEACGACHDNVNFTTGANHAGGPQPNSACATCHTPDGPEFGLSVTGAHTIPEKSKQLRGVNFDIVSFTNTKPGQSPTVVFSIKDNAGQTIQPSEMASLSLLLAGPTYEYSNPVSETATGATATDGGNFSYTFKAKIPDDATGTYAVGIQGYLNKELKRANGEVVKDAEGNSLIRDAGMNKVAYSAVTDSAPLPRKKIVDLGNCNKCHETLAAHGGSRLNTEYCVLCHNPTNSDVVKRTQAGGPMPPQTISFDYLIHKIHTGEDQKDKPFVIYGGAPANPGPVTLSEARYPTDRRNCTKCHVPRSNLLDFMHQGVQPISVKSGNTVALSIGAVQAACMSCHDSAPAKAHAETMTTDMGGEACIVCHGEGADFAVSKVHAQ
ncbi:MAG TPA: OmcA/MtrC family decaheme c-type cytochrome [Chloroflexota bacterium]